MKRFFGTRGSSPEDRSNYIDANWLRWCETVEGLVRFKPDRVAIRRELTAHYEDHCKDLERIGYDLKLTRERALHAMGDAEEVGRAMDRTHKPWLGWLWQTSRVLLLTLLAVAVIVLFQDGFRNAWERTRGQLAYREPPATAQVVHTEHADIFAAPRDLRWENGHVVAEIDLWAEMRTLLQNDPGGLSELETWDDRGQLYGRNIRNEDGSWPLTGYRVVGAPIAEGSGSDSWTDYHTVITLHLDHVPAWVDLTYPWGDGWALRITWEEGIS